MMMMIGMIGTVKNDGSGRFGRIIVAVEVVEHAEQSLQSGIIDVMDRPRRVLGRCIPLAELHYYRLLLYISLFYITNKINLCRPCLLVSCFICIQCGEMKIMVTTNDDSLLRDRWCRAAWLVGRKELFLLEKLFKYVLLRKTHFTARAKKRVNSRT
jgi:hypothetical protein